MPIHVYTGLECPHQCERLTLSGRPPEKVECMECGKPLIRNFAASVEGQKAWLPPMRKRMKKIFARWKNRDYNYLQGVKGTRNSFFDPHRRSK